MKEKDIYETSSLIEKIIKYKILKKEKIYVNCHKIEDVVRGNMQTYCIKFQNHSVVLYKEENGTYVIYEKKYSNKNMFNFIYRLNLKDMKHQVMEKYMTIKDEGFCEESFCRTYIEGDLESSKFNHNSYIEFCNKQNGDLDYSFEEKFLIRRLIPMSKNVEKSLNENYTYLYNGYNKKYYFEKKYIEYETFSVNNF